MTPRALVIRAAGTNTDGETLAACEKAGFETDLLHVNRLAEEPARFKGYQLFIVPGGFSYGDDLGSGRVFANELRLKLGEAIRGFVSDGNLVLGICNGFQILVKANLLPDPAAAASAAFVETRDGGCKAVRTTLPQRAVTLTYNDSGRFEDRWVRLKVVSTKSPFFPEEGWILETAVNHGEGKFVTDTPETLARLQKGGQVVLKYVDDQGREGGYPWNPNGSTENIAGICDPTGRVMGLMPHPEKHQDPTNHPQWTRRGLREADGLRVFRNAFEHVKRRS
jgi:phosphoribosylformylglycinamidine synthase